MLWLEYGGATIQKIDSPLFFIEVNEICLVILKIVKVFWNNTDLN